MWACLFCLCLSVSSIHSHFTPLFLDREHCNNREAFSEHIYGANKTWMAPGPRWQFVISCYLSTLRSYYLFATDQVYLASCTTYPHTIFVFLPCNSLFVWVDARLSYSAAHTGPLPNQGWPPLFNDHKANAGSSDGTFLQPACLVLLCFV